MISASMFHGSYISLLADAKRNQNLLSQAIKHIDTGMNNLCALTGARQNNVFFFDTMFQVRGLLNQSLSES